MKLLAALLIALPFPTLASEGLSFSSLTTRIESGGYIDGETFQTVSTTARAVKPLSWGWLGLDLGLAHGQAGGARSLTTASALVHLSAEPLSWLTVGPYGWIGAQSRGGGVWALGVEALVYSRTGWSGELYFGETRGGHVGAEGYSTNRGLTISYQPDRPIGGHFFFAKDTLNHPASDHDYYRAGLGIDATIPLDQTHDMRVSLELGLHHYDDRDQRENWVGLSVSIPLGERSVRKAGFTSRRGVLHELPLP